MKKSTHWERNREAAILDQANIEQEQQHRQSDEVRKRSTERAEGNVMTMVDILFKVLLACSRFPLTTAAWPGAAAFGHFTERCGPPQQCVSNQS